ncbi:DciA family protein [Vibrio sp. S4M6]|uniref:DUF721 domain-containing protein n=1 Tax=Vibrio sinus TaxID=2946865 RepID=UPI00202A9310|nr:DciA family protein [Vibrio sinus]MCL9781465.1 DciA family protein [Vibrio sinus]
MRDHRPTSTNEIIAQSKYSDIQRHSAEIIKINSELKKILSPSVADHCRAANVRGSLLILEAASGALKLKIEYERLSILNQLRRSGFAKLVTIEVKINPDLYRQLTNNNEESANVSSHRSVSDATAQTLLTVAKNAPKKVQLRLERIAQLAKSRQ